VGILAFDLSAAFDTVAKDQLLPKLAKLGTAGNALRWFNSYMSGGRKVVVWNGVKSDPVGMVYGVRQGSILGPLLYNVHVADMPTCLDVGKEYNTGYADNTKAWQVGDTLENVAASLQRVADRFAAYTKGNGPSLNAAKTQLMFNKKADGCSCRGRRIHQPGLQPRAAGGQVRPTPHHTALREGPGEGGEDKSVSHLEAEAPPPPWSAPAAGLSRPCGGQDQPRPCSLGCAQAAWHSQQGHWRFGRSPDCLQRRCQDCYQLSPH
jgi:hypothetical protein